MARTIVNIEDLSIAFKNKQVLKNFNLRINEGEICCVIGKSGSGKSVLLKCAAGLLKPDTGSITLFDREITHITEAELNRIRIHLGYVFQSSALYDSLTVKENLEFVMKRSKHLSPEQLQNNIRRALENVGLPETENLFPAELSGGMQKRIAIARAIVMEPKLILFDEPTAGLDVITSREISLLILKLQQQYDSTMLIISHDMESIKIINQRVVVLNNCKNDWDGNYKEMENSTEPLIEEYLGKMK